MFSAEHQQDLRRLRFPEAIESEFQRDYYARHRTMARITLWFLVLIVAALTVVSVLQQQYALACVPLVALLGNSAVLWRLHHEPYVRPWQPLGLGAIFLTVGALLCLLFFRFINDSDIGVLIAIGSTICVLSLGMRRYLRLQRRWIPPFYLITLVVILSWNATVKMQKTSMVSRRSTITARAPSGETSPPPKRSPIAPTAPTALDSDLAALDSDLKKDEPIPIPEPETSNSSSTLTANVFLGILLSFLFGIEWFFSGRNERYYRREFLEIYLLERERDEERDKRQHTEAMLHVLSQAIGSIVHDLGNPLTNVQTGAQTLRYFVENSEPDRETILEFSDIILDGAQMLNYLRLSLMEQTRVLEGKPIPVELKPVSLRRIVEAGAQYQKPKFIAGRSIELPEDDIELFADEMKLITVLMNLIGNALKYSDGPVRIAHKTHNKTLLIGIIDRGKHGRGISRAQAQKLFVPFGRLDTHSNIEGTGLGLLSVRAIAQAHKGDIYIEGREDGTPASKSFSTADESYPTLLKENDCTAFIFTCPLHPVDAREDAPKGQVSAANSTAKPRDAQPALLKV